LVVYIGDEVVLKSIGVEPIIGRIVTEEPGNVLVIVLFGPNVNRQVFAFAGAAVVGVAVVVAGGVVGTSVVGVAVVGVAVVGAGVVGAGVVGVAVVGGVVLAIVV
jgi:hypothetical protein